jgi:hypothetical protein
MIRLCNIAVLVVLLCASLFSDLTVATYLNQAAAYWILFEIIFGIVAAISGYGAQKDMSAPVGRIESLFARYGYDLLAIPLLLTGHYIIAPMLLYTSKLGSLGLMIHIRDILSELAKRAR